MNPVLQSRARLIKMASVMLCLSMMFLLSQNNTETKNVTLTKLTHNATTCVHEHDAHQGNSQSTNAQLEEDFKNSPHYNSPACWPADIDPAVIEEFYRNFPNILNGSSLDPNLDNSGERFVNFANERWTTTASGTSPDQGDCVTITWSIPPDGSQIINGDPLGTGGSVFTQQMDAIFGCTSTADLTQSCWFPFLQAVFDSWEEKSGVDYIYEPNDDGSEFAPGGFIPGPLGVLGVRGDVRIFAVDLTFFGNPLGINFFPPDGGDMMVDLTTFFGLWTGPGGQLLLSNTITHELGHGLGLRHVCPTNETKLMEPFLSGAFEGPQPDDYLSVQRQYGDRFCDNDMMTGSDVSTGKQEDVETIIECVSIDDENDIDFYGFTVTAASCKLAVEVTPIGETYESGEQVIPTAPFPPIGCPPTGHPSYNPLFNALAQVDLNIDIIDPSGSVIASANTNAAGVAEVISNQALSGAGQYFIRVTGSGEDMIQAYNLKCTLSECVDDAIPTMSEWGLMIFGLLMLNLGVVFLYRQEEILAGV